ncbi:MAG: carboxypeptidase-like regulatory domain-containing protein [Myxococcota bacterium]|nr:carboxypeptidase regulatory-like domain-containing protein [Deltaproteobacteria bacterium]MDQ3340486.1 carboxypeptidase-like regulatory domain-containing protein [Myxococcota bacterium]
MALVIAVAACGSGGAKPKPLANTGSSAAKPAAKKPATEFRFELVASSLEGASAEGVVRDSGTKEPLVGTTVVLSSPALQGEQVAITDEKGYFKLTDLPPGDYTLSAYGSDQTTQGKFKVEKGKLARITLDWDLAVNAGENAGEIVQIEAEPEPTFKTALEALRRGAMAQAVKLGRAELANKPTAQLHGVLAFATYGFALESFRFEGLAAGGSAKTAKDFKNAMANFLTELDKVQTHLIAAAKDPKFTLELCVACMAADDGHFRIAGFGALDVERDRAGKPIPEGDKRRRPTYRFDHGDLAWARAMISYHQAIANITLAYDWGWIDRLMSEDGDAKLDKKIKIKLLEPARIAKARELLLSGLVASDEARLAFLAETDDDREWVPSPKQKNYASPLAVDVALYKSWEDVVADVRTLVSGTTGISLKSLWSVFGEKGAPPGFIDLGAMLSSPKDIVFELGAIDRIEIEKNVAKRAKLMTTFLQGLLGNGYKAKMKASPLTDRLIQLRKDRDVAEQVFEDKLKYVLWLN